MAYIAMRNVPGCLSEMDPVEFDTLAEARVLLSREIDRAIDDLLECDQAAAERALASFDADDSADTLAEARVFRSREIDRAIDDLLECDQAAAERALASFDADDSADTFCLCGYVYTARKLAD